MVFRTYTVPLSTIEIGEVEWDGVDNKKVAWIRAGGAPEELLKPTVLAAEGLFVLSSNGRPLLRGCHNGNTGATKAFAVLGRVMSAGLPVNEASAMALYTRMSGFFTRKVINGIYSAPRSDGPIGERERLRALCRHKPATYLDSLLEDRTKRERGGIYARKEGGGYFVKAESAGKEKHDSFFGSRMTTKPRGIYTMTTQQSLEWMRVLEAYQVIYESDVFKRFHIKALKPEEVTKVVYNLTSTGDVTNTDYSMFESALNGAKKDAEIQMIYEVLCAIGLREDAERFKKGMAKPRKFQGLLSFIHNSRVSGDFPTAGGNVVFNAIVIWCCSYKEYCTRTGDDDLDRWWATADKALRAVFEGDDAVVDTDLIDQELIAGLGLKFSAETRGTHPLDTDFLHVAHTHAGRVGNTLRAGFRSLQTITSTHLKFSKLMFLARAAAWSMWCSFPGHPIIWAIVRRVGELTAGYQSFKSWQRYTATNPFKTIVGEPPSRFPRAYCNQELRNMVASSTNPGLPPISVPQQVALEARILKWELGEALEIGDLYSEYPEFLDMVSAPSSPQLSVNGTESERTATWMRRLGLALCDRG